MRVRYEAHLTHHHFNHVVAAHQRSGQPLHGKGFGKWLRKAAGTVGHALTHTAVGQDLLSSGAKVLGDTFLGPEGGKLAGNLTHQLLQSTSDAGGAGGSGGSGGSGGNGSKKKTVPKSTPPPPPQSQDGADESGFGVRRRAPAKKRAPAKRKRAVKRPF